MLRQLIEELPMPSDPPLIEEIGRVFGVEGDFWLSFFCLEVRIGSDVPHQVPFVFDINHILRHFAGISGLLILMSMLI